MRVVGHWFEVLKFTMFDFVIAVIFISNVVGAFLEVFAQIYNLSLELKLGSVGSSESLGYHAFWMVLSYSCSVLGSWHAGFTSGKNHYHQ